MASGGGVRGHGLGLFLDHAAEDLDRRIARDLALAQDDQPGQVGPGQVLEDRAGAGRREDHRGIAVLDQRADGHGDGADDAPGRVVAEGLGGPGLGLARRGASRSSSARRQASRRGAGRRARGSSR